MLATGFGAQAEAGFAPLQALGQRARGDHEVVKRQPHGAGHMASASQRHLAAQCDPVQAQSQHRIGRGKADGAPAPAVVDPLVIDEVIARQRQRRADAGQQLGVERTGAQASPALYPQLIGSRLFLPRRKPSHSVII